MTFCRGITDEDSIERDAWMTEALLLQGRMPDLPKPAGPVLGHHRQQGGHRGQPAVGRLRRGADPQVEPGACEYRRATSGAYRPSTCTIISTSLLWKMVYNGFFTVCTVLGWLG